MQCVENPEQIGFLGICGRKYPVKKGPNKIGRDHQTCNIVLNLNSVSRQHAVINVLNETEFMLMDLESANKTKLLGKTLMPYIPQPLNNGDTVQFGDIFGIFRLLQEQNELPMTQAINIPDTPVPTRHKCKLITATTIPESPDVSDKDGSFIGASQPKEPYFRSSNFIKPAKTISIQPIGGHKIDNVYWNSSEKSTSLNFDDSTSSLNDSMPLIKCSEKENANNIHETETPAVLPPKQNEFTDSIYEANTLPMLSPKLKWLESIHEANTQMPESPIPSIYTVNTQLPEWNKSSPSIYTADTQLLSSIHTTNTQVPDAFDSPSIHGLETQPAVGKNLPSSCKANIIVNSRGKSMNGSPLSIKSKEISNLDKSNDIVLFGGIEDAFEENFESQGLLTEDILLPINRCVEAESETLSQIAMPKCSKRNIRILSDSSTDCDDDDEILLTQKSPLKVTKYNDADSTDCEDEMIILKTDTNVGNSVNICDAIDLDDVATQVIEEIETSPAVNANIEDMLTQVIDGDYNAKSEAHDKNNTKNSDFEDLPTQVLTEDLPTKIPCVQKTSEVDISPFKIPLLSAYKAKKKDFSKTPKIKAIANIESNQAISVDDIGDKYYQNTQDVYEDLCTQIIPPPEVVTPSSAKKTPQHVQKRTSPLSRLNISSTGSDVEEEIKNFVSKLSSQDIRDVIIGEDKEVQLLIKKPSDASDLDHTPKKRQSDNNMHSVLPNSQKIQPSIKKMRKKKKSTYIPSDSSESEPENNTEDRYTPVLLRKKKIKRDPKLVAHINVQPLPTRVLTRERKPAAMFQEAECKKLATSVLKHNFLDDQEDDVDTEKVTEDITRLKNKTEKVKNAKNQSKYNKRNKTLTTSKMYENRSHIMIEPHMTTPANEEKPKTRACTRKSKETPKIVQKQYTAETKSADTSKIDVSVETKRPVRSSRAKKSQTLTDCQRDRRKRSTTQNEPLLEKVVQKEETVRRSARQKTAKGNDSTGAKSVLKKSAGTTDTASVKRSADDVDAPLPKRKCSSNDAPSRVTPTRTQNTCYVLFTSFPCEKVMKKLEIMGAVVVTDVKQCTVALTLHIRRTFKLLCAVGLGKPVVGLDWVQACALAGNIVDPWLYIIKDEAAEQRFNFNLVRTLSGKRNYLHGYVVSSTPHVMPPANEMRLIVEYSGGSWRECGGGGGGECGGGGGGSAARWLCVTCAADRALWGELRSRGAVLVTTEAILCGVLQQRLNIQANRINVQSVQYR